MFYYYGRKKQIAHIYPKPQFDKIIEPFAGSAAYSLHGDNWKSDVLLIDLNDWCIKIWEYLQSATVFDIKNLPDMECGDTLKNYSYLSQAEKHLIGLHINPGSSVPKLKCTKASRWKAGKKYIIDNLYKIKHWNIMLGSYDTAPRVRATWFIDPPYFDGGVHYSKSKINYPILGEWIMNRSGQIIACEGGCSPPDYLPFINLPKKVNNGGLNKAKRNNEYLFHCLSY